MDDLISRKALIAEYDRVHVGPPGGARKLIEEAPEVPPKVVAEIKIDNDALQRMVSEAVEQIKAELFGNSEQLDTISRQAAIDEIMGQPSEVHYPSWYAEQIKALPSAQPEYTEQDVRDSFNSGYACGMEAAQSEIIRCRDCRYGVDYYHDGNCYCAKPGYELLYFDGSWDFHCANAEREDRHEP